MKYDAEVTKLRLAGGPDLDYICSWKRRAELASALSRLESRGSPVPRSSTESEGEALSPSPGSPPSISHRLDPVLASLIKPSSQIEGTHLPTIRFSPKPTKQINRSVLGSNLKCGV